MFGIGWLDSTLILVLAVGLALGYVQGVLRQVINLAAMYLGAILAAQYYNNLANFFKDQLVTTPGTLLTAVSFFIIMFSVTALLNFLSFDAYKTTKLALMPALDHLGGMILGLIAAWILITLALDVLTFATSAHNWASAEEIRQVLRQGILGSQIAATAQSTLPSILETIKPWLPAGLPGIFNL
jgi:uncharacterized membrane protein required for colicin V production